jgi:hypothetical protein
MSRKAALVPELHSQTNHVMPFSAQHGRNGGRIHTARHGDCNGSGYGGLSGHNKLSFY